MIVVVVIAATSHSKICLPMPTPVMCAYLRLGVASGHLSEFVAPHLTFVFLFLLCDYFVFLFPFFARVKSMLRALLSLSRMI